MFPQQWPTTAAGLLRAEEIIQICPWLWSYKKTWATGFCSAVGREFELTSEVLRQDIDPHDVHIFLYGAHGGILHVVDKPCWELPRMTFAAAIKQLWRNCLPLDDRKLMQIVVRTNGPVDRTDQFSIYDAGGYGADLWPLVRSCLPHVGSS